MEGRGGKKHALKLQGAYNPFKPSRDISYSRLLQSESKARAEKPI